jgi:membrane protease YdiL (CAAX protease family)
VPLAPSPRPQRVSRAGLIILVYGGLGAIALTWGAVRGNANIYLAPGVLPSIARLAMSPAIGLAVGLLVVFLSRYATHRLEWARVLHREFHSVVHELSSKEIFLLAVFSSVGEELFFRGALLPQVGLVLSSLLFGVLHVRPGLRFLPWTLMSLIVGLVLGEMYLKLGDLGGPIVAHFTINLLNLNYISKTELRV